MVCFKQLAVMQVSCDCGSQASRGCSSTTAFGSSAPGKCGGVHGWCICEGHLFRLVSRQTKRKATTSGLTPLGHLGLWARGWRFTARANKFLNVEGSKGPCLRFLSNAFPWGICRPRGDHCGMVSEFCKEASGKGVVAVRPGRFGFTCGFGSHAFFGLRRGMPLF